MSYSSPLTFPFTEGGYSQPTAPLTFSFGAVADEQYLFPSAIEGAVGEPSVINYLSPAFPDGIFEEAFGTPQVSTTVIVRPRGLGPSRFGSARATRFIELEFGAGGYVGPLAPVIFDFDASGDRTLVLQGFRSDEYGLGLVENFDKDARPVGIYELAFGAHTLILAQQFAQPPGLLSQEFGLTMVENFVRLLFPVGLSSLAMGTPVMQLGAAGAFAEGFESLSIGEHAIDYYIAQLSPLGADTAEIGDAFVADAIRVLRADPLPAATWGDAVLTNYTRSVFPIGARTDEFGQPAVGFTQEIAPFGFEPLAFGAHQARDDRQFTTPAPFGGEFGLGRIQNLLAIVRPSPIADGPQFGDIDVFNLTQRASVFWPAEFVAGPVAAPVVSLKDRQVFPLGFDALRFPFLGPTVINGTPPIQATLGITAEWGFALVAHRIRTVLAVGRTHEQFSSPIVLNAAANFTPEPFTATLYGTPSVLNLWQYRREITVGATLSMGTPFVADAIRTLSVNGMFLFEAGQQHRVSPTPQYAEPSGISGQVGLHLVQTRPVRVIGVRQDQPGVTGSPSVANRNRSTFPLGFRADSHGTPDVQNYRRDVRPLGIDALQAGVHSISDRVKTLRPVAFNGEIGAHRARLFPEPPLPQYAEPAGFDAGSSGAHTVAGNGILPVGISALQFGSPLVRSFGIFPQGFNALEMADTRPEVISYQLILLGPTAEFPGIPENGIQPPIWPLEYGPRISPYTVWAPTGAPQQAMDNHPPGREEPIGIRRGSDIITGGLVENPTVSNYRRELVPESIVATIGDPVVSQTGRIVILTEGFRGRWGFPYSLGGDLSMLPVGIAPGEFGLARIEAPDIGNRTLSPSGITGAIGEPRVSKNPSEVYPLGPDALQMGGGIGGAGGLWVSREYPPFQIAGFEATQWGSARVSRNPETLHPFGWDSFTVGPELIEQRMRVRARAFIQPFGFTAEQFGSPQAWEGTRTIQAFSVFKQGIPAPRVQPVARAEGIAPPTIDPPVVDQVEYGILKAKGADSAEIGHAIITAAIRAPGLSGEFGSPGVYSRLAPSGWAGEFGAALVTGDDGHTCGMQARGARHVWTEAEAFGVAEVANG